MLLFFLLNYFLILIVMKYLPLINLCINKLEINISYFIIFLQKIDILLLLLHLLFIIFFSKINKKLIIKLISINIALIVVVEFIIIFLINYKVPTITYDNNISLLTTKTIFTFYNWSINPFSFIFDNITLVFSSTTLIIGFFANIYTLVYLFNEKNRDKFLVLLNLFILSMVFFVKTNSILVLIFCWEFLGISSFFLIGHYHNKPYSLKSAFKAFSFNRLSDVFFFLFIVLYIYNYGTFYLITTPYKNTYFIDFLMFLSLFIAASIKSAQGFFFFWLPDSMEAPIPASALIHSATLVSAGIYITVRLNYLIYTCYTVKYLFLFSGILTAVIFSFISSLQVDIKKLLAYSTIANCGFMYFLIGIDSTDLVLMYFNVHGLLKSLLFLFFGYLVILNNHNQDMQSWVLTRNIKSILYLSNFILILLGSFNLTLSYDIKHFINSSPLLFSSGKVLFINLLFYIYCINSFLYSFNFFFRIESSSINKKDYKHDTSIYNYKFICFFIVFSLFYFFLMFSLLNYKSINYVTLLSHNSFIGYSIAYLIFIKYLYVFNSRIIFYTFLYLYLVLTLFSY